MSDSELLENIQKDLSRGIPRDKIIANLQDKGRSSEDINGAFAIIDLHTITTLPSASGLSSSQGIQKVTLRQKFGSHHYTGIFIFLGLIMCAGGFLYWYSSQSSTSPAQNAKQVALNMVSGVMSLLLPPPPGTYGTIPSASSTYTPTDTVAQSQTETPPILYPHFTTFDTGTVPPHRSTTPSTPPDASSNNPITDISTTVIPHVTPAPTLSLDVSSASIPNSGSVTVTWKSTNATSCSAQGSWTGDKPASGSETFSNLLVNQNYQLTCTGTGGSVTQSAAVSIVGNDGGGNPVSPTPPPVVPVSPAPPPTPPVTTTPLTVAAGCTAPAAPAHSFYIDPINGSDTAGDGSQTKPWKTVTTVLTTKLATKRYASPYTGNASPVNQGGPIHPGDSIYLMSGNYGAVSITQIDNADFVTIAAAPSATPVLTSLKVQGASKFVFKGLTISANGTGAKSYVKLADISSGFSGPVNDIIFTGNTLYSQADVSSWSPSDWLSKAAWHAIDIDDGGTSGSGCITITNNRISNILVGVALGIPHTLYSGNTITNFGDDALDYAASDLVISHNIISNNLVLGDGNHPDGMQGQIGRHTSYSNVTIDGNVVIRRVTPIPAGFVDSSLQGIDTFDNDWNNLTVTNNIVITNSYQGLSFSSVHGGLIAHNTVLEDGDINSGDPGGDTGINVGSSTHEGTPTNDLVVENNLVLDFGVSATTTSRQNIAGKQVNLWVNGKQTFNKVAGTYPTNNILDPQLNTYLTDFDPLNYKFNVTPRPGTAAFGLGADASAIQEAISSSVGGVAVAEPVHARNSLLASVVVALDSFVAALHVFLSRLL
jgi:hypothetical protein